jgi:TP901 family phage tail tape measure protein
MVVSELEVILTGDNSALTRTLAASKNQVQKAAADMGENAKTGAKNIDGSFRESFEKVGGYARNLGATLAISITAPLALMGRSIIKTTGDFDEGLRNVDSLAKMTGDQFARMRREVLLLADDRRIKQAPEDLAAGLYDIYSSGFAGSKAMDILKVSAAGASAGMTDTATSSRALMAVLNSGIGGVNNAREAMDVLFKEVDLGVNSFGDLANQIGDVLPSAKLAGISLQEVGAGMAVLTRNGINAAESATALNQLILHIVKPSKEAGDAMAALGIQTGVAALESKGLSGWLADAVAKIGDNKQAYATIMPEVRAFKGLTVLASNAGKDYADMLGKMSTATDGAGATQAALNRQMVGQKFGFAELVKQLKITAIEFGDVLAPTLAVVVEGVRGLTRWLSGLSDGAKGVAIGVGIFAASIAPVLLALGGLASIIPTVTALVGTLAPGLVAAGASAGVLGVAVAALTSPVTWVIAAVAALVVAWKTNFGGLRDFTDGVVTQIVTFWRNNFPLIRDAAVNVFEAIKRAFAPFAFILRKGWESLAATASIAWAQIKGYIQIALTAIQGGVKFFAQVLTGDWSGAFVTMRVTTISVMGGIASTIATALASSLRSFNSFFGGIFGGLDQLANKLDSFAKKANDSAAAGRKAITGNLPGKGVGVGDGSPGFGSQDEGENRDNWVKSKLFFEERERAKLAFVPFNPGVPKMAGGKGDGLSPAPAMKAVNEQAEELRRTIAELTKATALDSNQTKSASIAYDLRNGIIEKGNRLLGLQAYYLALSSEAHERARKTREALNAITSGLVESTAAQVRATRASLATTVEDSIAIEKYGKNFADLTDEKNRAAVVDAATAKRDADRLAGIKSASDWVKQTVDNLREELALRLAKTRVDKLEIELSKEKYASLTQEQKAAALLAAAALDKDDDAKARVEMLEKARAAWSKLTAAVVKYRVELQAGADKRYGEQIARLTERITRLSSQSVASREQLKQLAEEFGNGTTAAERIADGMARAQDYMNRLFKVEQLEQFVGMLDKVADGFSTTLTDSLGALFTGGIKPFFSNLLEGFRSTLAEMAQEWLKSEIRRILSNGLRGLVGGIIGGDSGGGAAAGTFGGMMGGTPTGFATGGAVNAGELFRMNEHGRDEIFASRNGGVVIPASLSRQIAGGLGGGVNVYMSITTPNAESFRESEEQIVTRLAQKLAAVQRRGNA